MEPSTTAAMCPSAIALQTSARVGLRSDMRSLPTKYCDALAYRCNYGISIALTDYTSASTFQFRHVPFLGRTKTTLCLFPTAASTAAVLSPPLLLSYHLDHRSWHRHPANL